MFWKKEDKDFLQITVEPSERSAHRVRPLPEDSLVLLVDGQPCRVYDISASGASFQAPRQAVAGDIRALKFTLPHSDILINGRVRIVAADQDLARGAFMDLDEETKDQIHLYVLETQKRRIKLKKKTLRAAPSS